MAQLARSARDTVCSASEFILRCPELINRMRRLYIHDGWASSLFEGTLVEGFDLSDVEDDFYTPITRSFIDVLSAGRNLTSVILQRIALTFDMVRSISYLRNLHSLDLIQCPMSMPVVDALLSGSSDSVQLSWAAYNLRLLMDNVAAWYTLLLCPHLRTLCIRSSHRLDLPAPPLTIWSLCRFYPTLERLWLANVDIVELSSFVGWLQISNGADLRLTHFKLHASSGVTDADLSDLLVSLHGLPLQVLVLDGLADGQLTLFNGIAELFPSLIALTVLRRASNRQRKTRLSPWPHASWEYARCLAPLQNLRHFAWNMDYEYFPSTPHGLLQFEEGFPTKEIPFLGRAQEAEEDFFGIDYWTALPFAAYCPSLQTYTITECVVNVTTCRISKAPDGRIISEPPKTLWSGQDSRDVDHWNPRGYDARWKDILPDSAEMKADEEVLLIKQCGALHLNPSCDPKKH
jgi:hypothetical protein